MAINKTLQSPSGIISLEDLGAQPINIELVPYVANTTVVGALLDLYGRTSYGESSPIVHKTGNETLEGVKTFGSTIVRKRYGVDIDNNITDGNISTITIVDKNDRTISGLSTNVTAGGDVQTILSSVGKTTTSTLTLVSTSDGKSYITSKAEFPATSSKTETGIPNIGYINDPTKALNIVHREGDEKITGIKTFSYRADSPSGLKVQPTSSGVYLQYVKADGSSLSNIVFTETGKCTVSDPNLTSQTDLDIVNVKWANNPSSPYTNIVHRTGDESIGGNKTFTGVATFNNVIQGTALKAKWADLAEIYDTDREYPIGTLVQFGGEKEMTIASTEVNGVISHKPAVLMNSEANDGQPITMIGRVFVRVKGSVKKFDKIVLSDIDGVGEVQTSATQTVIARALQDKDNENEGLVFCSSKFIL